MVLLAVSSDGQPLELAARYSPKLLSPTLGRLDNKQEDDRLVPMFLKDRFVYVFIVHASSIELHELDDYFETVTVARSEAGDASPFTCARDTPTRGASTS